MAITLALGVPADIYLIDEPSAYLDSEQRIVAAKVSSNVEPKARAIRAVRAFRAHQGRFHRQILRPCSRPAVLVAIRCASQPLSMRMGIKYRVRPSRVQCIFRGLLHCHRVQQ